jgi:hypothetical protein
MRISYIHTLIEFFSQKIPPVMRITVVMAWSMFIRKNGHFLWYHHRMMQQHLPVDLVNQIAETVMKKLVSSNKVGISPDILHEDFDNLESLPYPMQNLEQFDFESMDPRFYLVKFPKFMEYLERFNCMSALEKVFSLFQPLTIN